MKKNCNVPKNFTEMGGCYWDGKQIVYCPLHEAAPDLLELARWVRDSFKPDERPDYVDALIKKAEGR